MTCDAGAQDPFFRFLDIELEIGEGFLSLQFFNSAGVCELAISCKVETRF